MPVIHVTGLEQALRNTQIAHEEGVRILSAGL
jgi:hypothetical protein